MKHEDTEKRYNGKQPSIGENELKNFTTLKHLSKMMSQSNSDIDLC